MRMELPQFNTTSPAGTYGRLSIAKLIPRHLLERIGGWHREVNTTSPVGAYGRPSIAKSANPSRRMAWSMERLTDGSAVDLQTQPITTNLEAFSKCSIESGKERDPHQSEPDLS